MFSAIENYIEPLILLLVALILISGYFRLQEHAVETRENAKIQKAEIYANAKIQSARIAANAEMYGFSEDSQDEAGIDISQLLPLLQGGNIEDILKTPQGLALAQKYLGGKK